MLLEPWCEARDSKARNTAVEPTAAHIAAARFREAAPPTQCAIASSNASCATTDARAAAVVAPAVVVVHAYMLLTNTTYSQMQNSIFKSVI